jgi:hypothetical protein
MSSPFRQRLRITAHKALALALSFLLLATCAASAQSVQQSGNVTAGHIPEWVTSGVVADGGSSADSPITSIGVTNNGGAGFCVNSDRSTAPGRNQLCFGASTTGAATISLQNLGNASAQNLNFIVNGLIVTLPTGGNTLINGLGPFTIGDIPCFLTTAGVIQDCGIHITSGVINNGQWQATPIALAFGGTGGTSASSARTNLGLDTMAQQNAGNVAITGGTITGMPTPSNASDVAIKSYVDAVSSGLNILAPSRLATAAVLPNTPTYNNGSSGVGATLTAGSNTTLTVDGTTANLNDVILVKNQAAPAQNGIYTVTNAGSGSAAWVLTRATYFNTAAQMLHGSYTFITAGSTNPNTSWTLQSTVTTVGTDPLNFVQFAAGNAGTVTNIATGTGLTGGPITSTGTVSLAPISSGNALANVSGGSAAPSATTPQALNQGGFTGMAPCGYILADNGQPAFSGATPSTTQMFVNQITTIVTCTGAAWVSAGWYADTTAVKVLNIIGGAFSNAHRTVDVTGQAGVGSCTATGVSDESHVGCNDPDFPCHVASTPTDCYSYVVAKTTTPGTINDIGFVLSRRSATNGPGATVQATYPYYSPYMWNRTTGQTTFAGETFRWYLEKLGSLYTILGDTLLGYGKLPVAVSGSTSNVFTAFSIPAGFTSPNTKNVGFLMYNAAGSSSNCGVAPHSNWNNASPVTWPNNPGTLGPGTILSGLMGSATQFAWLSSTGACSIYINQFTDSFGGAP